MTRVEVTPVSLRDTDEIERAISVFARSPNGGLIVTAGAATVLHTNLIITLAARHKLPAVYYKRSFTGGLVSMGLISSTITGAQPATSIASSRAKSPPTYRCSSQQNTIW